MRRLLRGAVLTAVWFGAWLLLVEKFEPAELIIGAVCALIAGAASELAWGTHLAGFTASFSDLAQAYHLPWLFLSGTVEIFKVLFLHIFTSRKAQSLMLAVDYEAGVDDERRAAMRRALAIGYTTMTPNFVIIGIDHKKRRMLYHQIARSDVPKMTQALGAKP